MATGRVPTTANSPLTTKGDLFGYSTAPARLAVGSDGETIVADSSTATGLRYQAPVNVNPVLNSAFQVWQRGTSFTNPTSTNIYSADRWQIYSASTGRTFSRQTTSDTTNLPFIQYCMRMARDNGNTATDTLYLWQPFETINSVPYAGKTITMSFYARKGANFSDTNNFLGVKLLGGTGTDQNGGLGYTGAVNIIDQNATLTTTWQRFTYTATVGTTITEITPYFQRGAAGTAGAADWCEITGIQIEIGSVATPFKTYAGTIQGELSAAQRYYWRAGLDSSGTFGILGNSGYTDSTTNSNVMFNLPVHMRIAPTSIDFPTLNTTRILNLGNPFTPTAASLNTTNTTADIGWVSFTSSGMTSGQFSQYTKNNNAASYIGFSAEL